jgi:Tol biopolymer transport system component
MEGDHPYKPLLKEQYVEFQPQVSPDGRWMAYTSHKSGDAETMYVRSLMQIWENG